MVTSDSRLVCHKITELYTKVPMMTCKQPKTHITSQRSPSHGRHSLQKTLNRKKDCGTFIYSKHFNILNQSYMKSSCGKISFKITCRILPVFETGIYDDKTRMHIHKKEISGTVTMAHLAPGLNELCTWHSRKIGVK